MTHGKKNRESDMELEKGITENGHGFDGTTWNILGQV
jgi:hypothetical protein